MSLTHAENHRLERARYSALEWTDQRSGSRRPIQLCVRRAQRGYAAARFDELFYVWKAKRLSERRLGAGVVIGCTIHGVGRHTRAARWRLADLGALFCAQAKARAAHALGPATLLHAGSGPKHGRVRSRCAHRCECGEQSQEQANGEQHEHDRISSAASRPDCQEPSFGRTD